MVCIQYGIFARINYETCPTFSKHKYYNNMQSEARFVARNLPSRMDRLEKLWNVINIQNVTGRDYKIIAVIWSGTRPRRPPAAPPPTRGIS